LTILQVPFYVTKIGRVTSNEIQTFHYLARIPLNI